MPVKTPLPLGQVLTRVEYVMRLVLLRGQASLTQEGVALYRDSACDCFYVISTDEEDSRVIGSAWSGFVAQRMYESVLLVRTGIDV